MNLVKRDEFDVLKKMVQKVLIENEELKKAQKKPSVRKKKTSKKKKKAKN
jgi:BMFP domain-containing protein YqiC